MRSLTLLCALALVPLSAGCRDLTGGDSTESYCSAVRDHQSELTCIAAVGANDALIRALDIFKDLESKAPSDITDDWQQLIGRVEALDQALAAADVDPASYDRAHPPSGLSAEQKARIDAAARELGGGPTLAALQELDQEARDVCQTPLTI